MIEGVVQNGVVVLDQPGVLPNGTRVRVELTPEKPEMASPTGRMLLKYVGGRRQFA